MDQILTAFERALALAEATAGATAPNPSVGCVLLDAAGQLLAEAAHPGAGQPHAEALAISRCDPARIHTVIVTLEPCNHHGRTGPCAEAVLATGASEVWYGVADPNPQAAGGADRLRAAGLRVRPWSELSAPLAARAARVLAPFASRVQRGRPFVTVKQALDVSGSMIPPPGQKTFTGPEALLLAHQLRRRADAILTGSGTVLADQPAFTVRHLPDIPGKSRILAILDRRGRVGPAYLQAASARGFRPLIAQDLAQILQDLGTQGCNEVLVEAGPQITQAIHEAALWDEWVRIDQGSPDRITITTH